MPGGWGDWGEYFMLGKPVWWHGMLAANEPEPGQGRGADGYGSMTWPRPGLVPPPLLPRTRHE